MSILTTYIDTSEFGSLKITTDSKKKTPPLIERPRVATIAQLRNYFKKDIDEFRAKYGKEEGEAKFFHDYEPDEVHIRKDNLFMFNGACALWQYALNLGSTVANSALGSSTTLLTNANTYLYVGDGSYLSNAITGTVSINTGSTTLTTSSGSSGLVIGNNLVIATDTSLNVYTIVSGSGTSWTISPAFQGSSNVSAVAAYQITPPNHEQLALTATTNIANQVADSTFPSNPYAAQFNAITGATNASPIVLTVSGADISANDIVSVVEVLGNTAAVGTWVANPASASSITLSGSTGNGAWTSGGYVTKRNVLTMQSTFGSSSGVFTWYEWGLFNGNGANKVMFNRRTVGLGSKASGTSAALKIGMAMV